jgi:hypothetical protein
MPNWCRNKLNISHDDPRVIRRIANAFNNKKLFSEFIPCPKELEELCSPAANERTAKKMIKKYGAEDWYIWRLINWGTKWDTGRDNGTLDTINPTEIKLCLETAWTPPIPVFDHWVDIGCRVRGSFCESDLEVRGTSRDKIVTAEPYTEIERRKIARLNQRFARVDRQRRSG